jgi:RimJ/RimL family protein N-acetyltransferase
MDSPMRYTLETEQLVLRPYGPDDWPFVHRLWSNPQIVWWREDDPMSEDETRDLHGRYAGINGAAMSGFGWWLAFERSSGELVGQAALKSLPERPGEIEVGWQLMPEHRRKGYATEAARGLIEHGFTAMALAEIVAAIVPENAPSVAVARRLRMTKTDELMKGGIVHHLFRVRKREWSVLE